MVSCHPRSVVTPLLITVRWTRGIRARQRGTTRGDASGAEPDGPPRARRDAGGGTGEEPRKRKRRRPRRAPQSSRSRNRQRREPSRALIADTSRTRPQRVILLRQRCAGRLGHGERTPGPVTGTWRSTRRRSRQPRAFRHRDAQRTNRRARGRPRAVCLEAMREHRREADDGAWIGGTLRQDGRLAPSRRPCRTRLERVGTALARWKAVHVDRRYGGARESKSDAPVGPALPTGRRVHTAQAKPPETVTTRGRWNAIQRRASTQSAPRRLLQVSPERGRRPSSFDLCSPPLRSAIDVSWATRSRCRPGTASPRPMPLKLRRVLVSLGGRCQTHDHELGRPDHRSRAPASQYSAAKACPRTLSCHATRLGRPC